MNDNEISPEMQKRLKAMYPSRRIDCPFPGCTGGCSVCVVVRRDAANRRWYEASARVLARPDVDDDARMLAEFVHTNTRPRWDVDKRRWIEQSP